MSEVDEIISLVNQGVDFGSMSTIRTLIDEIMRLRIESQANADTAMQWKQMYQDQCKRADDAEDRASEQPAAPAGGA